MKARSKSTRPTTWSGKQYHIDAVLEGDWDPDSGRSTRQRSPEAQLIVALIDGALRDAEWVPSKGMRIWDARAVLRIRDEARAWLRGNWGLLMAEQCFEVLGLDYEATMERIEKKWRKAK